MGAHHKLRGYRTVKNISNKQHRTNSKEDQWANDNPLLFLLLFITSPFWVVILIGLLFQTYFLAIPIGIIMYLIIGGKK